MALATEIIKYFSVQNSIGKDNTVTPKTLHQFLRDNKITEMSLPHLFRTCNRLANEGFLKRTPSYSGNEMLGDQFVSAVRPNKDLEDYGFYDFVAEGFPLIYQRFKKSVLPIIVQTTEGQPDIGSGFLLNPSIIVTAKHCMSKKNILKIPGLKWSDLTPEKILIPNDPQVDIAFIKFNQTPFPGCPELKIVETNILDEVISMGYPPFPGFESVLMADLGNIAGHLKTTSGRITGQETSYLDGQEYYLVSARVKGGNSGGPIINKFGFVVGVVVQLSEGEEGVPDKLGYGLVLPSKSIIPMCNEICKGSFSILKETEFEIKGEFLSANA